MSREQAGEPRGARAAAAGARTERERDDQALIEALSSQARALAEQPGRAMSPGPEAWHRLAQVRARAAGRPAVRWHWRVAGLALGTAGLAAALALVVWPHVFGRPRPLTFEVRGGAVDQEGYVRAASGVGSETGQVRFSDGTEIDLGHEARLSVVAPGPRGARLRLDAGQARFRVVHRPSAAWSVEAGPYVVAVTGTVFDVQWSSRDEVLQINLRQGGVRVSGPGISDSVPLRVGQRLTAHPARGQVTIERITESSWGSTGPAAVPVGAAPSGTGVSPSGSAAGSTPPVPAVGEGEPQLAAAAKVREPSGRLARPRTLAWLQRSTERSAPLRPEGASQPNPAETPTTEPPPLVPGGPNPLDTGGVSASARVEREGPVWTPRRWPARVARGEAAAVVGEAQQFGLAATLKYADPASLAALADAARYLRDHDLERQVLTQQRARFPRTRLAAKAAFLLGRSAHDGGDVSAAMHWYGQYLNEAPRGAYADEALGRMMLVVEAREGGSEARLLADRYLNQFPNGTYLLQARAILNTGSHR